MTKELESEVALPLLPQCWTWARVTDLGILGEQTVLTGPFGSGLGREDFVADGENAVPVLTIGCLQYRGIDRDKAVFVKIDKAAQMDRYRLRHGDIMFSRMATVGRAGLITREYDGALFNYHLMRLRLESVVIEPYFFIYFVRGAKVVADHVRAMNHGMTRDGINTEQLLTMPVAVAPRQEQARIVDVIESHFSRLDDAMATLERVERNLKRYRASVLKAAVEGRLVPTEAALARQEGRDYEPASVLLERILTERRRRWSESGKKGKYQEPSPLDTTNLPKLPEGWCWANVEQLASDVCYGSSSKTQEGLDAGVPVLRMGNIIDGYLDYSELKYLPSNHSEFPELLLAPGDILFNRTNSPELVGKTAVFTQGGDTSFASYLIRVRVANGIQSRYVSHFINSPAGRRWVGSVVTQQVGQANVNGSKLKACAIPLPPSAEQVRIVDEVERVFSLVFATASQVRRELEQSGRLRQSILKWAFEGKLADQDPSDEPASVLLERIKAERATATPVKPPKRGAVNKKARA